MSTENTVDPKVVADIAREVKSLAGTTNDKIDSFMRDLTKARGDFESGRQRHEDSVKNQIESFLQKMEAVDAAVAAERKRNDALELAIKRTGSIGGKAADDPEVKQAAEWKAFNHYLKGGSYTDPVDVVDTDIANLRGYTRGFKHLVKFWTNNLGPDEAKDLLAGRDTSGGYWVTPVMNARVQSILRETTPMRQVANVERISTGAMEFAIDDGEASAGWVGETEPRPVTDTPELGMQRVEVKEVYAKPRITQILLEDASVDVEDWLARKIADKFSRMENQAFVLGNGLKRPRGWLTYPNGVGRGNIPQIPTGAAAAVTPDFFKRTPFNLKERYLNNAKWILNRATIATVSLFKEGGTNNYIWQPGLTNGLPNMIGGYPWVYGPDIPVEGANNLIGGFGDWKEAYTILDRLGITVLRDPYSSKPYVEFYSRKRVGGDVINYEAIFIGKCAAS